MQQTRLSQTSTRNIFILEQHTYTNFEITSFIRNHVNVIDKEILTLGFLMRRLKNILWYKMN